MRGCLVYRLVAFAFLPQPRSDQDQVNHIDGNKNNNDASNLEWTSNKENSKHARDTGLSKALVQPISMYHMTSGEKLIDFDSIQQAHQYLIDKGITSAIKPASIQRAATGSLDQAFGYHWKYHYDDNGQVKKQRRK